MANVDERRDILINLNPSLERLFRDGEDLDRLIPQMTSYCQYYFLRMRDIFPIPAVAFQHQLYAESVKMWLNSVRFGVRMCNEEIGEYITNMERILQNFDEDSNALWLFCATGFDIVEAKFDNLIDRYRSENNRYLAFREELERAVLQN